MKRGYHYLAQSSIQSNKDLHGAMVTGAPGPVIIDAVVLAYHATFDFQSSELIPRD